MTDAVHVAVRRLDPELPGGYAGPVRRAAPVPHRLGVTVLNAPGTVDAGYRGEIRGNPIDHDRANTVTIACGARIARPVVQRVERAGFVAVDDPARTGPPERRPRLDRRPPDPVRAPVTPVTR